MRAVMPGYVNYFYEEGKIPTHTKESFYKYNILTIHGLIVKNALIFMHKINHFPELLPKSIHETILENAPTPYSTHENSKVWLKKYGQGHFNSSIFAKGPLLALTSNNKAIITQANTSYFKSYKTAVKKMLLELQNEGESDNWPNFLLYCIPGLRKSLRQRKAPDFYSQIQPS